MQRAERRQAGSHPVPASPPTEGSMINIRSIALSVLVVSAALSQVADAADRPSSKFLQSFAVERPPAERAQILKKLKIGIDSMKSKTGGGGVTPWECIPHAGCQCQGENGPDCDELFTLCDMAGGLWKCSSDEGGSEDVCICT
jgi:hypothetical protein